jgi:hypothetical protein
MDTLDRTCITVFAAVSKPPSPGAGMRLRGQGKHEAVKRFPQEGPACKRRFLTGVGDCVHSKHAVKYAAKISSAAKDMIYTLFHIQPLVPQIFRKAAQTDLKVREVMS